LASSDGTSGALFQIVLPTRERQAGTDGELRVDKLHRGEVGAILP
jgi:hypothetical protein